MPGIIGGDGTARNSANAIVTMPFDLSVSLGDLPGWERVEKFGRNPNIGTATTPEDVWFGGGIYTGQPSTGNPETIEVFSDNAADSAAGTGLRTLRVVGLLTSDSTTYVSEDLIMNGVTPVTSVNSWYRINRVFGLTGGSSETNVGTLTVRHTITIANIFAVISPGVSQTQIAAWTVPASRNLIVNRLLISIARSGGNPGSANIQLVVREFGSSIWRAIQNFELTTATDLQQNGLSLLIPARSDLKIRVESVSDNGTIVTGTIDGEITPLDTSVPASTFLL